MHWVSNLVKYHIVNDNFYFFLQRPLFNRCLPKITFPKAVIVTAEEENEVDQNATTGRLSTGNNVTETLDNLDPTFVDYEGWEKMMHMYCNVDTNVYKVNIWYLR